MPPEPTNFSKDRWSFHLELQLLVAQVEQLLEHQHFEYDKHVDLFPSRRALALLREGTVQQWTKSLPKSFPRDRGGQGLQGRLSNCCWPWKIDL